MYQVPAADRPLILLYQDSHGTPAFAYTFQFDNSFLFLKSELYDIHSSLPY